MTGDELLRLAEGIVILAGIAAVFIAYVRNQTDKNTIQSQRDLLETREAQINDFREQIKELQRLHVANEKAISDLQGQVKVYKELPLAEITERLGSVAETQREILKLLKKK